MAGKAFSNKQKKDQLQKKRQKKRNKPLQCDSGDDEPCTTTTIEKTNLKVMFAESVKLNEQPRANNKREQNRFNLQFMKDSLEELKRNKKDSYNPLVYRDEADLETEIEDFYKPGSPLDMPLRPDWDYSMTKEQLERKEQKYFQNYLNTIFEHYPHHELSYFEMNLETWRQLWRVLEISDIVLLIVDIRFPSLHFSPTFYHYCVENDKDLILVLNKIDLVPIELVVAWKAYFEEKFPKLHVLLFSSSKQIKVRKNKQQAKVHTKNEVSSDNPVQQSLQTEEEQAAIKSAAAEIFTARAHRQLYECVKEIVIPGSGVNLDSWNELTKTHVNESLVKANKREKKEEEIEEDQSNIEVTNEDEMAMTDLLLNSRDKRKKFESGFVTIGCCGFPNVGKSSLLNSLKGRKVVSVSRTPGHTKHLQTIFLTKSVRLCDCPGLVFPSLSGKPLQVLAGIYPIAQLQEPYSAIRYLAENIPVIDMLKIKHPECEDFKGDELYKDKVFEWSSADICEAWAIKRGYLTAKAGRPDVHRAANELLRMALNGRLCLSLKPKNFTKDRHLWQENAETKKLNDVIKGVELAVKEKMEKSAINDGNSVQFTNENDDDDNEDDEEEKENFENIGSEIEIESDQKDDVEENHWNTNPYDLLGED